MFRKLTKCIIKNIFFFLMVFSNRTVVIVLTYSGKSFQPTFSECLLHYIEDGG